MAKIIIDNSRYLEYLTEITTRATEISFGCDTYDVFDTEIKFTKEAQEFFNEEYDNNEQLLQSILNIHGYVDMD